MSFTIANLLWNRIDIYSYELDSPSPDDIGGFDRTASLKYASVPSNCQYLSGKKQILFGKEQIPAELMIFLDPDYLLETTDIIFFENKWYQILYIDNSCHKYHHLEVYVRCIDAPKVFIPESSSSATSSVSSSSSTSYEINWSTSSSSTEIESDSSIIQLSSSSTSSSSSSTT